MELPLSAPGILLPRSKWTVDALLAHADEALSKGHLHVVDDCIDHIVSRGDATHEQMKKVTDMLDVLLRWRGLSAMQQETAVEAQAVTAGPQAPVIVDAPDYVLENAGRPTPWPRKRKPPVAKFKRSVVDMWEAAAMSREAREEKGIPAIREETAAAAEEVLHATMLPADPPADTNAQAEEKQRAETPAPPSATKPAVKKRGKKAAAPQSDFGQDIYDRLSAPLRQDWGKVDTTLIHEFCHSIRGDTPRQELQAKLAALLAQITDTEMRERIGKHLIRLFVVDNLIKGSEADTWNGQLHL